MLNFSSLFYLKNNENKYVTRHYSGGARGRGNHILLSPPTLFCLKIFYLQKNKTLSRDFFWLLTVLVSKLKFAPHHFLEFSEVCSPSHNVPTLLKLTVIE
jgi:hypothetical protein